MPSQQSPLPLFSPNKVFHVLDFSPKEGERGVPITVRMHLNQNSTDAMFVRLVVGSRAVSTKVRELPNLSYGRWQLDATMPSLDPSTSSEKSALTLQAVNPDNKVLDSITFGDFSYWLSGHSSSPSPKSESAGATNSHRRQVSLDAEKEPTAPINRRRAATTSGSRPVLSHNHAQHTPAPEQPLATKSRTLKGPAPRRIRANSLMRSKFASLKDLGDDLHAQAPILQLLTPLESMTSNWDQSEARAGRRLVSFSKVQDGRRLIVSCQPIRQEDWQVNDSVISCIYRDETKSCYVTSVDIIYLLERLTNDEFPVEEKNRIRRNLEGLRPLTVAKHKSGFEQFFQRIMEFPDPKPRNIEKDLKVFEWTLLGQALDKILSKYSVYTTSSPTDSTVSLPSEINDEEHPPYNHISRTSSESHGHPKLVQPTPLIPKFETTFDERSVLLLSDHQPSEAAYDTFHNYPLYPSNATHTMSDRSSSGEEGTYSGGWNDGPQGDLALDDYNTMSSYQLAEMPENQQNGGMYGYQSEYRDHTPSRMTPTYYPPA